MKAKKSELENQNFQSGIDELQLILYEALAIHFQAEVGKGQGCKRRYMSELISRYICLRILNGYQSFGTFKYKRASSSFQLNLLNSCFSAV